MGGTSSFRITRTLFASCTPSKQDHYHGTKILNKKMREIDTLQTMKIFKVSQLSETSDANGKYQNIIKRVFCNFLLDFNRLLKSIKKRPQQTATTTIFKGNPPKLTKRKKKTIKKQKNEQRCSQKKLPSNPFLFEKKITIECFSNIHVKPMALLNSLFNYHSKFCLVRLIVNT